jgi:hypothetical protein
LIPARSAASPGVRHEHRVQHQHRAESGQTGGDLARPAQPLDASVLQRLGQVEPRQCGECLRVGTRGFGLDHRRPPLLGGQLREQAAGSNRVGECLGADLFESQTQGGDVMHHVGR